MPVLTELKLEYDIKFPLYDKLRGELVGQFSYILSESKIKLAGPIESRVKSWASISEKLDRNQLSIGALDELSDITGLRIICLFLRDVAEVRKIINSNFTVLREEDISTRLLDNQFGYDSVHFEIELPSSWTSVPTLNGLLGLKAEVQVRTVAQHAWAATSHVLQYKHEKDVPLPLRRSINRIAALLETVDLEFDRLATTRESYITQLNEKKMPAIDENLNVDMLRQILDDMLPAKNKIESEIYSELLEDLHHFQLNTADDLKNLIDKHLDAALVDDKKFVSMHLAEINKGSFSLPSQEKDRVISGIWWTHVGLIRSMLRAEFGDVQFDKYLKSRRKS